MDRLGRLVNMRPTEIAFRVLERGRTELERLGWTTPPKAPSHFKDCLGDVAMRFYRGTSPTARRLFETVFPQWLEAAIREADKLCAHDLELLAMGPVHLGDRIDWHRDPYSGETWERRFRTGYHVERDPRRRDPKVIHELNRHQHLPRLAKAYWLTGTERYAAEAVEQMLAWGEQNPGGMGINWQSSLEIGLRTLSWLWILVFIRGSKSLDDAAAQTIGDALFAQVAHIDRHTSRYSSPNTHLLGEALALFTCGLAFRGTPAADRWLNHGANILSCEAAKQIQEDGVYGERSPYYHCYTLDFYLQALALARQNGLHFPLTVHQRVESMLWVVMHWTRPDGTLPHLGDDDGGRALALDRKDYRSFEDGLCAGAILFRDPVLKSRCSAFSEYAYWLLGEQAWDEYTSLESRPPADAHLECAKGGYTVQRTGWGIEDSHLVFDCGGLGMLTGGHSHAGALSITLFGQGREILVDPGTFVYNGAPEWRSYFRSTAAHNTVTVDGRGQAEMAGPFRWNRRFHATVTSRTHLPQHVDAWHDAYERRSGIMHRRRVVQTPGRYWVLIDRLSGSGRHAFDFRFHLGPEVEVSAFHTTDSSAVVESENAGFSLAMYTTAPLAARLVRGQTSPIEGWASHGYGERHAIHTLDSTVECVAPLWAMTLLVPARETRHFRRLPVERGRALACSCQSGPLEDIVVATCGEPDAEVAGFRMSGEFFWIRLENGRICDFVAIGADCLQHGDRDLLENNVCAQFAVS